MFKDETHLIKIFSLSFLVSLLIIYLESEDEYSFHLKFDVIFSSNIIKWLVSIHSDVIFDKSKNMRIEA
jgi:hypothetical protein